VVTRGNYEAHQPPLAYLLLAPLDGALARLPLTLRVLVLRLFCGVGSVLLLFAGASALCRALQVPEPFATAALFGIFCSEMFYATSAHGAPGRRTALAVGAWLAAGLLTKAYFLVFAVFAASVAAALLVRRRVRIGTVTPRSAVAYASP